MIAAFVRRGELFKRNYVPGRFLCLTLILFALIAPRAAEASTYRWSGNVAGNWNDPGNWVLVEGPAGAGYPNLPGDVASIEGHLALNTDILIPDGVAISIGRLSISADQFITIASGGTGLLIFDNAGEDAVLEVLTLINPRVSAPVRLDSNLEVRLSAPGVTQPSLVFAGGISEAGGARSVTKRDAGTLIYDVAANTYTGPTIIRSGTFLTVSSAPATVRVAGDLIVGPTVAFAQIYPGQLAPTADVTVDGGDLSFVASGSEPESQTIGDLAVRGAGNFALNRVDLDVANINMGAGDLEIGLNARLVVHGDITAESAGGRILRLSENSGSLRLNGATHTLTAAGAPDTIGVLIDVPISGVLGGEGLTKQGPGAAALLSNNTYSGPTTIAAGRLYVIGGQPGSAVTISGGTLAGVGTVGPITATGGSIAPGGNVLRQGAIAGTIGILRSGSVALGTGTTLHAEVGGTIAVAFDQLQVTGTVDVTNATLQVTDTFDTVPPPLAEATIIQNDGSDPVQGMFAGLPEGATISLAGGARYVISYRGGDGNDVVLTNITPLTYFLTEGATGTFFEENVLIANGNTVEAPVTLTFLLSGGGTVVQSRVVPAQSRLTLNVAEIPGLEAVSASVRVVSDRGVPLAVERTMFWDHTRYGGHTTAAVSGAQPSWYFAEGSQGVFDTYLLLANSNDTPVDATIRFLREFEPPVTETVTLEPFSRRTIYAGDYVALVGRSFGIVVNGSGSITAERAMYFGSTPQRLWSGGHGNAGTEPAQTAWYGEGATGTFFSTFFLLSNPNAQHTPYTLTFLLPDGRTVKRGGVIDAGRRLTINPAFESPLLENASFSTIVSAPELPIVSERAMYWPGDAMPWGEGHASSGALGLARVWDLAEGRVGGPEAFATYILLGNPFSTPADVTVTFLRETGAPIIKTYTVGARSRFNVDVGSMVPELQNESFGARVTVTNDDVRIVVERSMYWNANGINWAGGTNTAGTPQR